MIIQLKTISKTYGTKKGYRTVALDNIDLNIKQGELTAIIGKSGCGKSTLLNILGGLVIPDSGEYYYNNKKLRLKTDAMSIFRRDHIGIIVQNFALINNRTAYENIKIASLNRSSEQETKNAIERAAKNLGIYDKLHNYPNEMSGGECQRTAIARALIKDPDIILADEPTGALDSKNSSNVLHILQRIAENNKSVVIVTHDLNIASKCDNVIEMSDGKVIR